MSGDKPKIKDLPEVAGNTPRSILNKVVLPAPFGPRSAKISPLFMERLTLSRAGIVLPRYLLEVRAPQCRNGAQLYKESLREKFISSRFNDIQSVFEDSFLAVKKNERAESRD